MNQPEPEKPAPVTLVRKSTTRTAETLLAAAPENSSQPSVTTPIDRPPTAGERFTRGITQPAVSAPVTILCLALLAWSFFVRLPERSIIARARPIAASPQDSTVTPDDLFALKALATSATSQLITNLDQLPRLISRLEQQARLAGFVTELTTRTPIAPDPAVPELTRHPVVLRLENNPDREEPAFTRLLDWMRETSTLGIKVELTSASLQSAGDGLTGATIEVHLLSLKSDAETAPK